MKLRPLQDSDISTYADWGADRLFCEQAGWTIDLPRAAHEAHWQRLIDNPPITRLAAVDGDEVIGYVDLAGNELGYAVGPSTRWGQGLGTAIAHLGLQYGFTVLGLDVITAEAAKTNHASLRILQRLGMTETTPAGAELRCFEIARASYLASWPA